MDATISPSQVNRDVLLAATNGRILATSDLTGTCTRLGPYAQG